MAYIGPARCPNCNSPVDTDAMVCPYCHSTAPASAPWQSQLTLPWLVVGAVLLLGGVVAQKYFGVDVLAMLRNSQQ